MPFFRQERFSDAACFLRLLKLNGSTTVQKNPYAREALPQEHVGPKLDVIQPRGAVTVALYL